MKIIKWIKNIFINSNKLNLKTSLFLFQLKISHSVHQKHLAVNKLVNDACRRINETNFWNFQGADNIHPAAQTLPKDRPQRVPNWNLFLLRSPVQPVYKAYQGIKQDTVCCIFTTGTCMVALKELVGGFSIPFQSTKLITVDDNKYWRVGILHWLTISTLY